MLCAGCFQNAVALKFVIALFLQSSFFLGTLKSFAVYLPELAATLGITSSDIGLSLGLFSAFSFGPGPIVAYLYRRLHGGYRRLLVMMGAFLAPGGLILGSFVTSNAQLATCLCAAGLGSCILSLYIVVAFRTRCGAEDIGCLLGVGRSGYAIGLSLIPLLADYLMELYGWRGSLMMIGALMGHMIPLTMMMDTDERDVTDSSRRPEGNGCDVDKHEQNVTNSGEHHPDDRSDTEKDFVRMEQDDITDEKRQHESLSQSRDSATYINDEPSGSNRSEKHRDETVDMFDDGDRSRLLGDSSRRQEHIKSFEDSPSSFRTEIERSFKHIYEDFKNSFRTFDRIVTLLMIIDFVFQLGDGSWCSFLVPHALARGVPTKKALFISYSAAAGSFIGRIFGGVFLRFRHLTPQRYFLLLTILNIAALLSDVLIPRFEVMVTTSFINAITMSERGILIIVIFANRISETDFPLVLALSDVMNGVGMFLGAWFSGLLADACGSLDATFIFVTATEVLVFLFWLPLVIVEFIERNTLNE